MVAVAEWDAGGLAPVMQTFTGPLGVFDHSARLCTASDRDNVQDLQLQPLADCQLTRL